MVDVKVYGDNITSVKVLRVLRTVLPVDLKQVTAIANDIETAQVFTLLQGVSEAYATAFINELAEAGGKAKLCSSVCEEASVCMPLSESRRRWNKLGMLVDA